MSAKVLRFPIVPTMFPERRCFHCGKPMGRISELPSVDGHCVTELFGCHRCDTMVREDVAINPRSI